MIYYYLIAAMLTMLSLIIFISVLENKKVNYYYTIMLLLIAVANAGYLSLALSNNVSEAILANKISYLGGCFIQPVTLFLICTICNYKVAKWLRVVLYTYSFIVYCMVLSIGFADFYYESVYLETYANTTVLGHTYGIGHVFFYVILYGYSVAKIILLVYSIAKKRTISRKNIWALVIMEVTNISMFVIGRMINSAIEIMPLAYVIDSWILLYMSHRSTIYNIEDNIEASFHKKETNGYIMFDLHLNYLGCNKRAVQIFPALAACIVDKRIDSIQGLDEVKDWLNKYIDKSDNKFTYEKDEFHYECHIEQMMYKKKACGYMLELHEDTDNLKYMKLLATHNSELERFQIELEKKVEEQTAELKVQQKKMKKLFLQTVTALSDAVDAKDRYTSGHSKRVAEYARMLAARMGKNKEEQDEIYRAGLLHDVGKIRIPAEIINKPGKLTDEEYSIIKLHSITGYHILRGITDNNSIAVAAKYHHERYDGKGYPNGIVGDKIPEIARILGVADAYDAMASNRSYRKALPQEIVRDEIEKGKGTQFDPVIADLMLDMIDEDKEYSLKQTDSMERKILVVDDEVMNHKMITYIMKDEPMYTVESVESGIAALEILEQKQFDLILLDIKMPGMDGLETLRRIRQTIQTPVVLMTGDKTIDISMEISKYGCDDYITKPFLPLMIKEVVHNMIERTNIEIQDE